MEVIVYIVVIGVVVLSLSWVGLILFQKKGDK